ncbi:MAG: hypothetical protein ABJL67_09805 [Sulfitobacter sp.]
MATTKVSDLEEDTKLDMRTILAVINKLKRGEFDTRAPEGLTGIEGKVADALNDLAEMNETLSTEISNMSSEVQMGRTRTRISRARRRGGWATSVAGLNSIADDLTAHTNGMVQVIGAVAKGDLTRREETELRKLTDSIIVKDVNSPERLLDETALFLHRVEANLPDPKQKIIRGLYRTDPALAGKKVLIVDDDARNIFATTSILEPLTLSQKQRQLIST